MRPPQLKNNTPQKMKRSSACAIGIGLALSILSFPSSALNISQTPLFVTQSLAPLVMLTMARDHKLYYEAYNDYSDLDGDGQLDIGYKPSIEYYGYFDSNKCYTYDANGLFRPSGNANNKKCTQQWSGDFLNYVTMSRMDTLRKVLYGGYRSTDTTTTTVLERSFIPQDAHSWGKEYQSVARDGYKISDYTPFSEPIGGKYLLFANTTLADFSGKPGAPLMRVLENTNHRVWEWLSIEQPVAGADCVSNSNGQPVRAPCGSIKDFVVRIEVCNSAQLESKCKSYTNLNNNSISYKPIGVLQEQGEGNGIFFGLMSGSYTHNTEGGVLRKAVSSINNEIMEDGRFGNVGEKCRGGACVDGIISTLNKFKITGFNYNNYTYDCGWITDRSMKDGECEMWGNPIGEMLYETIRYYAGKPSPTAEFDYDARNGTLWDNKLGLPKLSKWNAPYVAPGAKADPLNSTNPTFHYCAKPFALLISDVYPSFDSNSIPGAHFPSDNGQKFSGDIGMDANALGLTMWNTEIKGQKNVLIGETKISGADSAPTAKAATNFNDIRGLAPGEPTRQGSYSSAIAAYYGHTNIVNGHYINNDQRGKTMDTYSIALSAPLPKIEIPVKNGKVTIQPFAKSVNGYGIDSKKFSPTNQIVDFYVDTIRNVAGSPPDQNVNQGDPYYKFRINFEDVEQGADHDMDAIAIYEVMLKKNGNVSIKITSEYAAGSITQHLGFVISGTKNDRAYLLVRDVDTVPGSDVAYHLDCRSNSTNPSVCAMGSGDLPTVKELEFEPSATPSAELLNDPLWYAAKWGSFYQDSNADSSQLQSSLPDTAAKWDANNDGKPDNYYLTTNPLTLERQLNQALASIRNNSGTAAATSSNSSTTQSNSLLYVSRFDSSDWQGEVNAKKINLNGSVGIIEWQAQEELAKVTGDQRTILTFDPEKNNLKGQGIPFVWDSMSNSGKSFLRTSLNHNFAGVEDNLGSSRVKFLRGDAVAGMRVRPNLKKAKTPNKLGDIINSQSQYVAAPDFGYADASYANFRKLHKDRTPMVYVGANDGMLHGFVGSSSNDIGGGKELIAYIPSEMYRKRNEQFLLSKLTESNYGQGNNPHHYYVDGSPTIGDVCTQSCATEKDWQTILVGGLRAGGQGIYALNITDPKTFNESNASSLVMWEFTDKNDVDLGYTFSRPTISKVCTQRDPTSKSNPKACAAGRWVVIFGNGYNSSEADGAESSADQAVLYIVDALDGTLLYKFSTKTGSGLSSPAAVDIDDDDYVDYVFAGDLQGHLWKFDLSDEDTKKWGVAYKTGSFPAPLYTAKSKNDTKQTITSAPEVILHPDGGMMVMFGTGSYIETTDNANVSKQSFYGIRDNNAIVPSANRNNLVEQITATQANYRGISNNSIDWDKKHGWYIDLPDGGERVVSSPRIFGKILAFTSIIPEPDPCKNDGRGGAWDYYIDPLTGGSLNWKVIEGSPKTVVIINDISIFFDAGAIKSSMGISGNPNITIHDRNHAKAYKEGLDDTQGNPTVQEDPLDLGKTSGRVSWREILSN